MSKLSLRGFRVGTVPLVGAMHGEDTAECQDSTKVPELMQQLSRRCDSICLAFFLFNSLRGTQRLQNSFNEGKANS